MGVRWCGLLLGFGIGFEFDVDFGFGLGERWWLCLWMLMLEVEGMSL